MNESVSESTSRFHLADERTSNSYYDYKPERVHGVTQLGKVTGYGRVWFVKSLAEDYRDVSEYRRILIKEYEIMLSLLGGQVPHAVALCEIEGAGLSIVMEHIEGEHLDKYLAHASRHQRRIVIRSLAEAVAFIHSRGVAHLDLKPENILVRGSYIKPEVCLIDFNLSDSPVFNLNKEVGGNLRYAAPEQFEADYKGDVRADVWSLGKLLKDFGAGMSWRRAISRALRKNPEERAVDASAMLMMERKSSRRIRVFIRGLGTVAAIGAGLWLWHTSRPAPTTDKTPSPTVTVAATPMPKPATTPDSVPGYSVPAELPMAIDNTSPSISETDTVLARCERERDRAVATVKRALPMLLDSIRIYACDTSLPPIQRRTQFAIQSNRLYSRTTEVLRETRSTFPEEVLAKHSVEWCSTGDADLRDFMRAYWQRWKELDAQLEKEVEAEKARKSQEKQANEADAM